MERQPVTPEKVHVQTNQEKVDELISLAENPQEGDTAALEKAFALAAEAFDGYAPGIKDHTGHFALYKGTECIAASFPGTEWYNPNVDWSAVKRVVETLLRMQEICSRMRPLN